GRAPLARARRGPCPAVRGTRPRRSPACRLGRGFDAIGRVIRRGRGGAPRIALACGHPCLHYSRRVTVITNNFNKTNVSRRDRGVVVWLTGLSGAGKTTIAEALAA